MWRNFLDYAEELCVGAAGLQDPVLSRLTKSAGTTQQSLKVYRLATEGRYGVVLVDLW